MNKETNNNKEIEKHLIGVALNEKIRFEIVFDKPTFFQRLLKKTSKVYEVAKYTTTSQNLKITEILLSVSEFKFDNTADSKQSFEESIKVVAEGLDNVYKHTDKLIDIISILFSEKNKTLLKNNLSNRDISDIILQFFGMIDLQSFAGTIALIRNKASLKKS